MMKDLEFKFYSPTNGLIDLVFDPIGWNEELIKYSRTYDDWGAIMAMTIPLKFVEDDATVLRQEYYTKGVGGNLYLKIYKRNIFTNVFELSHTAKFDFSTVSDGMTSFECAAIIHSHLNDIKNNLSTKYDISIRTLDKLRYSGISGPYETITQMSSIYNNTLEGAVTTSMRIEMDNHNFKNINSGAVEYLFRDPDGYNITALRDCKVKVNTIGGSRLLGVHVTSCSGATLIKVKEVLIHRRGSTITQVCTISETDYNFTVGTNYDFADVSLPHTNVEIPTANNNIFDLQAGDQLGIFLIHDYAPMDIYFNITYTCEQGGITQHCTIYDKMADLEFYVTNPLNLVDSILTKINPDITLKSNILTALSSNNTDFYHRYLAIFTPRNVLSYMVNGAPVEQDYFSTSLQDFLTFMDNIGYKLGVSIEVISGIEYIVIENWEYFLTDANPFDLGDVKDCVIETASEIIPNNIKWGFTQRSYMDGFGNFEPFGEWEASTPVKDLKNSIDWVEKVYRMDITGFDYVRKLNIDALYSGANASINGVTNSSEVDGLHDIFVMDCKFIETIGGENFFELRREITINNTDYPYPEEAYNLEFTPRRNLDRKITYLNSVLHFFAGENLTNTSSARYPFLISQKTGFAAIGEGSELVLTTAWKPFYPLTATFTAAIIEENSVLLANNPNLYFKATFEGVEITGYLLNLDDSLAYENTSTVKILLSSNNILTNFVR